MRPLFGMLPLAQDETPGMNLDAIVTYLQEQGAALAMNLLGAIAIFVIGRWVAKRICALTDRTLGKAKVDETLTTFIGNIVYAMLLVIVVIAALNQLGVPTTSAAAVVGAAGLAIGLSLQDSLKNFSAGVMIILFKPFQIGHFVEAGGTSGVVEEIHIFNTMMKTVDNRKVIVPNGQIIDSVITNFSANSQRRIDLVIGCGYDDDLRAVKSYLLEVLAGDDRVLTEPAPEVSVSELADSSVNFVVRPWVNSSDYWATKCDLLETIKLGFDERGFNIPYPQREVHLNQNQAS